MSTGFRVLKVEGLRKVIEDCTDFELTMVASIFITEVMKRNISLKEKAVKR